MKEWITVMPGYVLNVTIYEVCWKECLSELPYYVSGKQARERNLCAPKNVARLRPCCARSILGDPFAGDLVTLRQWWRGGGGVGGGARKNGRFKIWRVVEHPIASNLRVTTCMTRPTIWTI